MSSQISADYRPDIDGMRAIAILSILFFHAGFPGGFSGGFVGVDIFFVISGYLITKNIVIDMQQRTFSFNTFYIRRARRLFPALLITLFLSFLAGFMILTPRHLEEMAGSAFASLFAVANFFFVGQIGYFTPLANFQPLLHTWALSIEEQFIILWPLTLYPLLKAPRNLINKAIISVIILTCLVSVVLAALFAESISSYYFTPVRVYEFMVGAILVFLPAISSKRMCEVVFILGASMMAFSIVKYSPEMPFPSYYALMPTVGAAFTIAANNPAFSGRVLNNHLMISIGRISYSLYLVHWPINVFANILKVGSLDIRGLYVIILSFMLAVFMFFYVEKPFRYNKQGILYRSFLIVLPVVILVMAILFLSVWINKGCAWRYSDIKAAYDGTNPRELSDTVDRFYYAQNILTAPLQKPGRQNILVTGDSHSKDVFLALATNRDLLPHSNLYHLDLDESCFSNLKQHYRHRPTVAARILQWYNETAQNEMCAKSIKAVLASPFAKSANIVIIATYLTQTNADCLPEMIKFHRAYSGAEVVIMGVNRLPFNPATRVMTVADTSTLNNISYNLDRSDSIKLNHDLKSISEREGARYFDMYQMICNDDELLCHIVDERGMLLFRDEHHWSFEGMKYFGRKMIENGLLGK